MKDTTAHTGAGDIPALRVRDSTAAASAWLDMSRYSNTVGMFQRYTPGGAPMGGSYRGVRVRAAASRVYACWNKSTVFFLRISSPENR